MDGRRDNRKDIHKLDFLKKKISAPYQSIEYWLTVPEFVDEMLDKVSRNAVIDDAVVYEVMNRIYDEKAKFKWTEQGKSFNYRMAWSAVKRLRKVLSL